MEPGVRLGKQILNEYKQHTRELRNLRLYKQLNDSKRVDWLEAQLSEVESVIAHLKFHNRQAWDMNQLFRLLTSNKSSYVVARELYISRSTLFRRQRELRIEIAEAFLEKWRVFGTKS